MPESAYIIASVDDANLMPGELLGRCSLDVGILVRNEHIYILLGMEGGKKHTSDYNSTPPILPLPEFGC
jgi:hypothetical protein